MKKNKRDAPWKNPRACLWCFCALALSIYLTIYMPASSKVSSVPTSIKAQTIPQNPTSSEDIAKDTSSSDINISRENKKNTEHAIEEIAPKKTRTPQSNIDKIVIKAKYFAKLFLLVGIAAFIGAIIEARRWHMVLAKVMGKLTSAARLPEIVGLAMPTALFSNAAANTILVNSHSRGDIQRSALIAGGMVNSYLSYVSHSLRVMYPVVAAIGLPGILYFTIQFSGGLLLIFFVLLWNRWYINHHPQTQTNLKDFDSITKKELSTWDKAIKLASLRTLSLIFRMLCITVPLMIGVEYLLKAGVFDFWENSVPESINMYFKGEMVSIVLAQMGGLIQSSAVSANLLSEGIINNTQILLAMLIGSAVGNPVRMLRRNLPSALAIFPPKVACIIVFGMQFSRLVITITASYVIILIMKSSF